MSKISSEVEAWAAIPGYDATYEVSTIGRVRCRRRVYQLNLHLGYRWPNSKYSVTRVLPERYLKPSLDAHGYPQVSLSIRGRKKTFGVHQLMLRAFVGPDPEGCVGCHFNDVKTDNRLANLRWGTHQENSDDKFRNAALRAPG